MASQSTAQEGLSSSLRAEKGIVGDIEAKEEGMFVKIMKAGGVSFNLEIVPAESVDSVKTRISDQCGIPPPAQRLISCGRELEHGSLSQHLKHDQSVIPVLHLCTWSVLGKLQVHISWAHANYFEDIWVSDTIESLKARHPNWKSPFKTATGWYLIGKGFELWSVGCTDTVHSVSVKIKDKEDVPMSDQCLINSPSRECLTQAVTRYADFFGRSVHSVSVREVLQSSAGIVGWGDTFLPRPSSGRDALAAEESTPNSAHCGLNDLVDGKTAPLDNFVEEAIRKNKMSDFFSLAPLEERDATGSCAYFCTKSIFSRYAPSASSESHEAVIRQAIIAVAKICAEPNSVQEFPYIDETWSVLIKIAHEVLQKKAFNLQLGSISDLAPYIVGDADGLQKILSGDIQWLLMEHLSAVLETLSLYLTRHLLVSKDCVGRVVHMAELHKPEFWSTLAQERHWIVIADGNHYVAVLPKNSLETQPEPACKSVAGANENMAVVEQHGQTDGIQDNRRWAIKLKCKDDVYRVRLDMKAHCDRVEFGDVSMVIRETFGVSMDDVKAKYYDAEQDHCVLCAASFTDFLETAVNDASNCKVLKLDVFLLKSDQKPCIDQCNAKSVAGVELNCAQQEDVRHSFNKGSDNEELAVDEGSEGSFVLMPHPGGRCFLTSTVLMTSSWALIAVDKLKVGDKILASCGREVEVAHKQVHAKALQELRTLRTPQQEITVTPGHRVVAPNAIGGEKLAKDLLVGDLVVCGERPQRLTKVTHFEERVEVVELRFHPDYPVEARMVAKHGILTKGEAMTGSLRSMGPLGPFPFEIATASRPSNRRARSAER